VALPLNTKSLRVPAERSEAKLACPVIRNSLPRHNKLSKVMVAIFDNR